MRTSALSFEICAVSPGRIPILSANALILTLSPKNARRAAGHNCEGTGHTHENEAPEYFSVDAHIGPPADVANKGADVGSHRSELDKALVEATHRFGPSSVPNRTESADRCVASIERVFGAILEHVPTFANCGLGLVGRRVIRRASVKYFVPDCDVAGIGVHPGSISFARRTPP